MANYLEELIDQRTNELFMTEEFSPFNPKNIIDSFEHIFLKVGNATMLCDLLKNNRMHEAGLLNKIKSWLKRPATFKMATFVLNVISLIISAIDFFKLTSTPLIFKEVQ